MTTPRAQISETAVVDAVFPLGASSSLERRGLRDRVYELVLDMLLSSGI